MAGGRKAGKSVTDMGTWRKLLEAGGCTDADIVLRAFRRIVAAGSKGDQIDPLDVLTVRACGRKLVETYRRKAIKEGDSTLREVQHNAFAEVKGAAGLAPSLEAIQQVLGHERDVILAMRLWEAAERAEGQSVVGVVGAAHVPGIRQLWPRITSPELEREYREYLSLPRPPGGSLAASALPAAATGALLGYVAWKQPRVALTIAAAGALVTAPYLGFATAALSKWQSFTKSLVEAAQAADELQALGVDEHAAEHLR